MSHQRRHNKFLKFPNKRSDVGLTNVKYNLKQQNVDTVDTSCHPTNNLKSSIAASLPANKKMISIDKSNLCRKNIPIMKSSKMSEVASICNEKDSSHFYKESSMELFQKLWLPRMIDYLDL